MKKRKLMLILIILFIIIVSAIAIFIYQNHTTSSRESINIDVQGLDVETSAESNKDNDTKEYVEGQAIIMTKNKVSTTALKSKNETSIWDELKIEETLEFNNKNSINTYKSNINNDIDDFTVTLVSSEKYTTEELIEKLKDEVIYVEPNYILHSMDVTNDTYQKYQWGIENTGQNGGTPGFDINPQESTSTQEKVIAVVDSGVDYTHEDLKDIMWNNTNSSIQGTHGYDFFNDDNDPMDDNGHGTHCAGIIAGQSNNEKGITGAVLENANIKIMALKITNSEGNTNTMYAYKAYNYIDKAQQQGINIVAVNNSWGGKATSKNDILKTIIDKVGTQGALSICGAGNDHIYLDGENNFFIPSDIDSEYIVSVAASNEKDELASFSNYGKNTVDIAAPGANILSTVQEDTFNPSIYTDEQRAKLCKSFENFDDKTSLSGTNISVDTGNLTISSTKSFGGNGKSLKWTIQNAIKDEKYKIKLPIKASQIGIYCFAFMVCFEGSDYWTGYSFQIPLGELDGIERDYIVSLPLTSPLNGDFIIYIDDYAQTNVNPDTSEFGKYKFLSGTSMATPFVTAAVGTIANKYENTDPLYRKEILLSAVRPSDDLSTKVITGGTLDLSKLQPEETEIIPTLNLSKNESTPSYIKDANISINNTEADAQYECNIDNSGWNDCTDNKIVLQNGEKKYSIQVRKKGSEKTAGMYYCVLDTTSPQITITPSGKTESGSPININVQITENGSGLKNTSIKYAFNAQSQLTGGQKITYGKTVNIDAQGRGTITYTQEDQNQGSQEGNYLYIDNIEDKAGNIAQANTEGKGMYKILPTPYTDLETDVNSANWNSKDLKVEVKGTVEGYDYEYSIDGGNIWNLCEKDTESNKWYVNITKEGINKFKFRIKNETQTSKEYYYKLDKSIPQVSIEGEKNKPSELKVVAIDEYSGLSNNIIQYLFSTTEPTEDAIWKTTNLNDEGKGNIELPDTNGTYNIYVKPVTDNVGLTSTVDNANHVFEEYIIDTSVIKIPVMGITVDKNTIKLHPGETELITATVQPSNATNKEVTFTSSDTTVATVSSKDGLVTAVGKGKTIITATTTDGEYKAICNVEVEEDTTGGDDEKDTDKDKQKEQDDIKKEENEQSNDKQTTDKTQISANKKDKTLAKTILPNTGMRKVIIIIGIILIGTIIFIKKYRNLKDIK